MNRLASTAIAFSAFALMGCEDRVCKPPTTIDSRKILADYFNVKYPRVAHIFSGRGYFFAMNSFDNNLFIIKETPGLEGQFVEFGIIDSYDRVSYNVAEISYCNQIVTHWTPSSQPEYWKDRND